MLGMGTATVSAPAIAEGSARGAALGEDFHAGSARTPSNQAPSVRLSPAKLAERYNKYHTIGSHPALEAHGYEILETIGVGGYSKVKLAIHTATSTKV
jgi:hypothetical protein